jgi:hypothetical protein
MPDQSLLKTLGAECGDGWEQLVTELYEKLKVLSPNIEPAQIKEKFGGLRFYVHFVEDGAQEGANAKDFYELIYEYERKSFEICELCGEKGILRIDRPWLKTLCDKHHQERN